MNKALLMGHAGQDAEKKYLSSGVLTTKFSLATTEKFKQNDEWKEKTDWHNIVIFGDKAEYASKVRKGDLVLIEGKISQRSWTKDDGTKAYMTEINAQSVKRVTYKDDSEEAVIPDEDTDNAGAQHKAPKKGSEDEAESLEDMGL
jgi:single-strand DNA-binding protein